MDNMIIVDDVVDQPLTKEGREKLKEWYIRVDLAKPLSDHTIFWHRDGEIFFDDE